MAINQQNIPVTVVDKGLIQNKSSLIIDPAATPACQNIVIHDGVVKKRTGLVWVTSTFNTTAPDEYIMGFYHYQNFKATARKQFCAFSLKDNAGFDGLYHIFDFDTGHGGDDVEFDQGDYDTADNLLETYDYWTNTAEVVNDTTIPKDATPDTEYLIVNTTPTHDNVSAGSGLKNIPQYSASPNTTTLFGPVVATLGTWADDT